MSTEKKFDNFHTEMFELGLQNRREVVGDAYVDAALNNGKSEFAYPGQQLVTESRWCWGNIWSRPGLDRKQRSLLNLGMLIAIKSWPELGVHVRGALNNGLTEIEIRESILHATIYVGVPAGVEAFKVAQKTINDMIEKGEHKRELAELSPFLQKST
ncbi:4-carboxymuconolactone decarboxylase [Fusarium oxysporum f. sp. cubense race 1]|uniref:4-carboxymuconolactone decarboxylase n=1 Tax=Fusarium oxysporum f. sp. cubense (strain race 1) TaxID=1229664 RepID=N4UIA1_FUSC1|nr:4-carboxymuconolactone decarboxylase [Fusarium oxysporum f. sp. cubense race 1]